MKVTLKKDLSVGYQYGCIELTKDLKALSTTEGEIVEIKDNGVIVEFCLGFKKYRRLYSNEMVVAKK
jgi:hypothetical protein